MNPGVARRLCASLILVLAFSFALAPQAVAKRGRGAVIAASGSGFLPAGHFIDAKLPMVQVWPRPDSETASWAREHWAFYNGTTDLPYYASIDVNLGSYPYVYTLESGPPGMTIEQATYDTFRDKNYGRIIWHPQGNITQQCNDSNSCSYTVSVLVTDQQHNSITISWKLQTDDDSTTYEAVRHFVFVSPTGSGSTCTLAAPCTLPTAFGSTYASTTFPGAICYLEGGTYTGTNVLPVYTDGDFTAVFEFHNSQKPAALVAYPGQTPIIENPGSTANPIASFTGYIDNGSGSAGTQLTVTSVSSGTILASGEFLSGVGVATNTSTGTTITGQTGGTPGGVGTYTVSISQLLASAGSPEALTDGSSSLAITNLDSADLYVEGITFDGYTAGAGDYHLFFLLGSPGGAATNARMKFDNNKWTNSGWGAVGKDNAAMFTSNGIPTPKQYLSIDYNEEDGRQSGSPGNNFGLYDLYAYQYVHAQGNFENSPSSNFDEVAMFKSDIQYSENRENYADINGASYAVSYLQNQDNFTEDDESDYNLLLNVGQIALPITNKFSWGNLWAYRNTILTNNKGLWSVSPTYNLEGPAQNNLSATTGTLADGQYWVKITSCGVTSCAVGGESDGWNGITGASNEKNITLATGGAGGIVISWSDLAQAPGGYGVYISPVNGGAGSENVRFYVAAGTTSFTYTGQAGTAATPPSSSTAVSAARFEWDSNIAQTSSAFSPIPPQGAATTYDSSTWPGLNVVCNGSCQSGATPVLNADGTLNSANSNYSTYLGTRGYQIQ